MNKWWNQLYEWELFGQKGEVGYDLTGWALPFTVDIDYGMVRVGLLCLFFVLELEVRRR